MLPLRTDLVLVCGRACSCTQPVCTASMTEGQVTFCLPGCARAVLYRRHAVVCPHDQSPAYYWAGLLACCSATYYIRGVPSLPTCGSLSGCWCAWFVFPAHHIGGLWVVQSELADLYQCIDCYVAVAALATFVGICSIAPLCPCKVQYVCVF